MKQLHPEFGLNLSIEICRFCQHEQALVLQGDNVPGRAPEHIHIDCSGRCAIIGLIVLVEMENGQETGYAISGSIKDFGSMTENKTGRFNLTVSQMKQLMGKYYRQAGEIPSL